MLEAEYKDNPTNTWCLWFLLIRYQKLQKLNEYILAACDFVLYHTKNDDWYNTIYNNLRQLYTAEPTLTDEQREYIKQTLSVEKTFI
jgi:hypothetical protein